MPLSKKTLINAIDNAGFPHLPPRLAKALEDLDEEALEELRTYVKSTYDKGHERGHWAGRMGDFSGPDADPCR